MHYLIDAYNLLFRIQKKTPQLEACRKELIEQINEAAARLHLSITLVFDGADPHSSYASRAHFDTLSLVYTPEHQTADDYIIQEVSQARHPSQLTVVTNDRDLAHKCRLFKAQIQTTQAFFAFLIKKEKRAQRMGTHLASSCESSSELARLLAIFEARAKEEHLDL